MTRSKNRRNHFIAYVRWDIILEWMREEIKAGRKNKKGRIKPYAYGTDAEGIWKVVKEEDILWILTIPRYGRYSSLPSLNTMIVVDDIINQKCERNEERIKKIPSYIRKKWISEDKWQYVIIGAGDISKYFPINDSYDGVVKPLLKGKIRKLKKRIKGEKFGYIGQHFQKIRQISRGIGERIYKYHEEIEKTKPLFISYKHGRGSKIVKGVVENFLKQRINCWLDISRIPRNLSDEESKEIAEYLESELVDAVDESAAFLSITRKDYFDSYWTLLEYVTACEKKGKDYHFWELDLNRVKEKEGQNLIDLISKELSFSL
jgi:hypothetical protein